MIPTKVIKDIDDIKSPAGRILITVLLLAVIFLTGIFLRQANERLNQCERHGQKQDIIIDSLKKEQFEKSEIENKRLIKRIAWQDSVKQVLQTLIDKRK